MFLISFLFLLFQATTESIASVAIPIVVMLATIGAAYGLSLNGSRTMTVIGAVAAAYAALAPMLSNFTGMPNWLRVTIIIVGVTMTTLNERIQGGMSTKAVVSFLCAGALLVSLTACGPPSKKTIQRLHAAAVIVVNEVEFNASLPDQLLAEKIIDAAQYGVFVDAMAQVKSGAASIESGLATALTAEKPSLKQLAPITADIITNLRALRAFSDARVQRFLAAVEIGLRVLGSYFALQVSQAHAAGYNDEQVAAFFGFANSQSEIRTRSPQTSGPLLPISSFRLLATAYDGSRFEEYAAAL